MESMGFYGGGRRQKGGEGWGRGGGGRWGNGKRGGGEKRRGRGGEMGRGEGGRRGEEGEGEDGGEDGVCSNIHKYLNLASKELVLCSLKFILINKRLLSGAINIEK